MIWYNPRTWLTRRPIVAAAPLPRTPKNQALAEDLSSPAWVREAWRQYDVNGDVQFAARWNGRAVSRAHLIAAKVNNPNDPPEPLPENHPAQIEVAELCGGKVGQSKMLRRVGTQIFVGGDSRLIMWETNTGRDWAVRTPRQISNQGDGKISIKVNGLSGPVDFVLPDSALIVPIREEHPDRATEPDSSIKGVLASLRQIEWCTNMITSMTRSRLVMLGILLMSSDLDFPARRGVVDPVTGKTVRNLETFWDALIDGASEWIDDPLSPDSSTPFLIAGKPEAIKATTLIQFATGIIDQLTAVGDKATEHVRTGMDIPPELLSGLGKSKFYNAVAIGDEAVKTSVEPILDTIGDGLTVGWLRPTLRASGYTGDDINDIVVWRDLTELTGKPNKSQTVQDAFDRFAVSFEAYRSALNISEADAPEPEEIAERLRIALVQKSSIDPSTIAQIGQALGVVTSGRDRVEVNGVRTGRDDGGRPVRAPEPDGTTSAPNGRIPGQTRPGLVAAARAMVTHALDYTGRRYLESVQLPPQEEIKPGELYLQRPVPVDAISTLMDGCWDNHWRAAPDELTAAVDGHVRWLLLKGQRFNPSELDELVRQVQERRS